MDQLDKLVDCADFGGLVEDLVGWAGLLDDGLSEGGGWSVLEDGVEITNWCSVGLVRFVG